MGPPFLLAVLGEAIHYTDFSPGLDRITYSVAIDPGAGPFTVTVELWFQPIGYRWAENLAEYDAFETARFVRFYREVGSSSAIVIAEDSALAR